MKALGKEEISKKIQRTSLPSALFLALDKDPLCRVPCIGARQSFFLYLASKFFVQPFLSTRNSSLEFKDFFVTF